MDDVLAGYGGRFLLATAIVSVALIVFVGMLWILKRRAPTSFVRVKRNKKSRLQVLDHAAIDTRRQIVLIRRDDVEHLLMIGGSSDIVIESNIPNRYSAADGQNAGTFENPSAADTFDVGAAQPVSPQPPKPSPRFPLAARQTDNEPTLRKVEDMERGLDEAVSMLRSEAELTRVKPDDAAPPVSAPDQPAQPASPGPKPGDQTMSATVTPQTDVSRGNPVSVEPMGFSTPPMQPAKTILTGTGSIFTDEAEDVLERARQRIMKPSPRPQSGANHNHDALPAAAKAGPAIDGSPEIKAQQQSWTATARSVEAATHEVPLSTTDFESILQAEMDRIPMSAAPSSPSEGRPARTSAAPPITGVSRDEQILQNEIAKIFGEMTFDRKKN
ncbi:flagellar biosynthetic protein FliO [Rhizobium sp. PAMB 3182]